MTTTEPKRLLVGYKASDLDKHLLAGDTVVHVLDIYHRHAIEKVHHAHVICSPHLPSGPWDEIRFRTGPKLMSGELALDLLQEIHLLKAASNDRTEVIVEYVGKERDKYALLTKITENPKRIRSFESRWKASVQGIEPIELASVPGCFCHRRADEGGLALAEVVVKEMKKRGEASSTRLLDMGCGAGLVGFLIAKAVPGVELVMVDSHSRAVEAAQMNAERLAINAEIILADNGTPSRMDGTFDVFVGNPPYYSEYRIAEVFYATALRALKPGGRAFVVCKNSEGLLPVAHKFFPQVDIIARRGYHILCSTKAE